MSLHVQYCEEAFLHVAAKWGVLDAPQLSMDLPALLEAHLVDPQVALSAILPASVYECVQMLFIVTA